MSSNTIKIIAGVFVVLAIILAVAGFRLSRAYAQNAQGVQQESAQAKAAAPQTLVVVATKALFANQVIARDSVSLIPVQVAPVDYFASLDDVVGRTPMIDVDAGAPLTPRFFKDVNPLAKLIPAGSQAISLALNDVLGVGNFIHSGDIVDVLLYLKNDSSNRIDPAQARILLKDALVLAYDERITTPVKDKDAKADEQQNRAQQAGGRHERTVVIAVPTHEVTRVMLGASLGELRLALHGEIPPDVAAAASVPSADGAADAAPSALPLSDAAKAKAAAAAVPDNVITATELAVLGHKTKSGAPAAGIQVFRGNQAATVYP